MARRPSAGTLINWAHPASVGLVSAYPLSEGSGSKVSDSVNLMRRGTLTNIVQSATAGWTFGGNSIIGPMLRLDGTDDYLEMADAAPALSTHTEGTISMWYSLGAAGNVWWYGAPSDTNWATIRFTATTTIEVIIRNAADLIRYTATTPTQDNSVHHLLLTGGPRGNAIYYDGRQLVPSYSTGSATTTSWLSSCSVGANPVMRMGVLPTSTPQSFMAGRVANLLVFNKQKTQQDAWKLYSQPWICYSQAATLFAPTVAGVVIPVFMNQYRQRWR